MTNQVINFLSILNLISHAFLVAVVLVVIIKPLRELKLIKKISDFSKNQYKALSLLVALVATIGSLFLSEVAKFTPCTFCWYQRILMYPLVFIIATAMIKKLRDLSSYVLPLSVSGLVVAVYHYYMQLAVNPLAPCSSIGFSVSCTERFFTNYGYITIPLMSATAFLLISFLMLLGRKQP